MIYRHSTYVVDNLNAPCCMGSDSSFNIKPVSVIIYKINALNIIYSDDKIFNFCQR